MLYIIFSMITVFLSLWGFADLIKFLLFRLFESKNDSSVIIVSPLGKSNPDAEFILRGCCEKVKWMGRVRPKHVICLDMGMDKTSKDICNFVAKDYGFLKIATPEELLLLLKSEAK